MSHPFIALDKRYFSEDLATQLLSQPCRTIFLRLGSDCKHARNEKCSTRNEKALKEWAALNGFTVIDEAEPTVITWDIRNAYVVSPRRAKKLKEPGAPPFIRRPYKTQRTNETTETCYQLSEGDARSNSICEDP